MLGVSGGQVGDIAIAYLSGGAIHAPEPKNRGNANVSKDAPSKRRKPVRPTGVVLLGSSSAGESMGGEMDLPSKEEEMEDPLTLPVDGESL